MLCTKFSDKRTEKIVIRQFEELEEGEFFIQKNGHFCVKISDSRFWDFFTSSTDDWDCYNLEIKENIDIDQVDVTVSVEIKDS